MDLSFFSSWEWFQKTTGLDVRRAEKLKGSRFSARNHIKIRLTFSIWGIQGVRGEEGRKKSWNSEDFPLIKMHEAELCFEKLNYWEQTLGQNSFKSIPFSASVTVTLSEVEQMYVISSMSRLTWLSLPSPSSWAYYSKSNFTSTSVAHVERTT